MAKKALLTLDMQSLDLNIPFKGIYNAVSNLSKSFRFSKAVRAVRELESKGIEAKVIALDSRTEDFLKEKGISTIAEKAAIENLYDTKYGEISYKFLQDLTKTLSVVDPASSYKGVMLPDLDAKNLWRSFIFPSITALDTFLKVIKKERPQEAIVLNREHAFQKVFKVAAESSGIKVIDRTNAIAALPWFAKQAAMKNFGSLMAPAYLRNLKERKIASKPVGKKKIIIAHDTIGPGKVLPWAKKLAKKYEVVYVGVRESGEEFEKAGIKYRKLQDYATSDVIRELKQAKISFRRAYREVIGNPKLMAAMAYDGADMSKILDEMLIYLYYISYPILAAYIELFDRVIEVEGPDVMITVDELSRFGRSMVRVANSRGVGTMVVQHGALHDHPLLASTDATKFAAYGEQTKKILLKRGARANQIEIVGQAEKVPTESPEKIRAKICATLNLDKHRPIITFASQALADSVNYPNFEMFYNGVKDLPELQFVVKLHPDESQKLHCDFAKKLGLRNVTIIKDVPIKEIILASDLVINIYSTVGMEALSLGKPLISINVNLPKSYFPEGSGAHIASNAKSLKSAISSIINKGRSGEGIKKTSRHYILEVGERACDNVAKAVDKLVRI